jgi:hypothetical protein
MPLELAPRPNFPLREQYPETPTAHQHEARAHCEQAQIKYYSRINNLSS